MYGVATQNGVGLGVGNIPTLTSLAYPQMLNAIVLGAFSGGAPGWLYDDSNMSTLFQDAAGTTPVTALEQPVGKQLDLSGRGNHRTQPTSANRPTWSARYNLLTKTEAFGNAYWVKEFCTVTDDASIAPDGTMTADKFVPSTDNDYHRLYSSAVTVGGNGKHRLCVKPAGYTKIALREGNTTANYAVFDLTLGTVIAGYTATSPTITALANGFYEITMQINTATQLLSVVGVPNSYTSGSPITAWVGDGVSGWYIWGADLRPSDQATGLIPTYQRVNTATDYDSVGFPAGLRWNGSNSWMQNASVDFSGTNKAALVVGMRSADATQGMVCEFSATVANPGTFYLYESSGANVSMTETGTLSTGDCSIASPSPVTRVLSGAFQIGATPTVSMRLNGGASSNSINTTAGTGNFGNYPAYFGARAGSSLFFNGLTFSNIAIGIALSASQIAAFEAWTNSRARAY